MKKRCIFSVGSVLILAVLAVVAFASSLAEIPPTESKQIMTEASSEEKSL